MDVFSEEFSDEPLSDNRQTPERMNLPSPTLAAPATIQNARCLNRSSDDLTDQITTNAREGWRMQNVRLVCVECNADGCLLQLS